uniref:Adenosine deaminase n=1 Tax=Setaria digitata TaxID=48799 RepID=A0A915PQ59_9BILA
MNDEIRKQFDFPKVELHLHLDGAIRHQTLLDLSIEKKIDLNGAKTVDEVRDLVVTYEPSNLSKMLEPFDLFLPLLAGDKDAIERIAYELCEDEARNGVVYFEARYSPHLLCNTVKNTAANSKYGLYIKKGQLEPQGVIEAVSRGFIRGEKEFGVRARSILCCIHGFHDWNDEVLELATKLSNKGVVGIDIAGCSLGADEQYPPSVKDLFQEAARRGIHRTVHAGESGDAKEVVNAIEQMRAERIGHGYRLLRDESAYKKYAIEKRTHFEACIRSSVMTGSVPFATDGINFSLSTDDPTCFDNSLLSEYQLAYQEIGLTKTQLWQCNLNAARSCFAEEPLKSEIIGIVEAAKV